MKCKKVLKDLSAYADGEVGSGLRERMERHLEVCEGCAAELSRLREVTDAAKRSLRAVASAKSPPQGLRERVMEATEPLRPHRAILIPAGRLAAGAIGIALASGLLVGAVQELRFRSERAALSETVSERSRELRTVRRDSEAARTQLSLTEAKLRRTEAALRLASSVQRESEREGEGLSPEGRRPWPVLCSLQTPEAESLLKNGLF